MGINVPIRRCRLLAPIHPTWQSSKSRNRAQLFLVNEKARIPEGLRLNVGSGARRFAVSTINIDLLAGDEVDVLGDLLCLPVQNESVDSVICTGVLEHVANPGLAVKEIYRILKPGGRVFFEVPFMQTYHASPQDYYRWTPDGLRQILKDFILLEWHTAAGPGSALAWIFQETMAMTFSMNSTVLYKIGLRIFGYLAWPISLLDFLLEDHSMAWHAASGFSILGEKGLKHTN